MGNGTQRLEPVDIPTCIETSEYNQAQLFTVIC